MAIDASYLCYQQVGEYLFYGDLGFPYFRVEKLVIIVHIGPGSYIRIFLIVVKY